MIRKLKKYAAIFFAFAQNSLAAQMQYRVNFLFGMLVEAGYFLAKLTYVFLVYETDTTINGMTPDYIIIFIGTYAIQTGLYMCFFPSICKLAENIRTGDLDFYLVKPMSPLFLASFRYLDFAMPIPNILGGSVLVAIGWKRCGFAVSPLNLLMFLFFILCGTLLTYEIFLLPKLLSFWFVSANGVSIISDSIWDFNNMPMKIYHRVIQFVGCFIFPIFLITNIPGLVLGGQINKILLIWSLLAPIVLMGITIGVWKTGLKRYASASS